MSYRYFTFYVSLLFAPVCLTCYALKTAGMAARASLGGFCGQPPARGWHVAAIGPRDGDGGGRWDTSLQEVDESREKLESVKVALVSAAVGSATLLPLLFFREDAEWQVKHVGLALSCVLFGITYRYAVRRDGNPNLKQGVVGAFSVTRALAAVTAPAESCSADLPLDCGPPFRLFTWTMLGQGVQALLESAAVLGLCALLLDALFALGWLSRFPTTATMTNNNTNSSKNNGRPS